MLLEMQETASILLEDTSHPECILRALNNMRILGLGCDAVLSTEDGGMFRVHRSIMSRCSTYFRTVFTTSLIDVSCGDGPQMRTFIIIPNVSSSILEAIILYAYTGETSVTETNVQQLLPAADQFNVLGLVDACVDFLVQLLNPRNCIGIWIFGREYFLISLEENAFKYILHHFLEVADRSREFMNLSASNLKTILKEDMLNAEQEISVWNSVKLWICYDVANRMRFLPGLLASVRIASMPIDDFQALLREPILAKSLECRPYITKVANFLLEDLDELLNVDDKHETNALFHPRLPQNLIFCIGGLNRWRLPYLLEAYDSRMDSWKQIETNGPLFPRIAFHQCISLDKYIYVIGGTDGQRPINSCCRLDTEAIKFEEIASMNENRCSLCAVEVNGKIYAIGGYNEDDERSKTAECFIPDYNQWTYIASMSFERSDAGSCHLRNRIIIAGGHDGFRCLNSVEVYYVEFDQWCLLPEMNGCKAGLTCTAFGDFIYAFGGFDGEKRLKTVEKYDVSGRQWYAAKPMRRPRSNFGSTVLEGKIYLMGGYVEGVHNVTENCECFDPSSNKWKMTAPLSLGLAGIASCTHSSLKNVRNYLMDSESRSVLRKYLVQEQDDINRSRLTFDVIFI